MKKDKIFLAVYHPVGGIRTFFRYVYRHLDLKRYSFTLAAPELDETHVLLDDLSGSDLRYIPVKLGTGASGFLSAINSATKNEHFDLVHSHGLTSAVCSSPSAIFRRIPHIVTLHDVFTEKQFAGTKGFAKRMALGLLLATVSGIHCVSYDARDNLLDHIAALRLFRDKIKVIPHGIDVRQFVDADRRDLRKELGLGKEVFLIGFLGRFMSQKGFRYLIEAIEIINKTEDVSKSPMLLTFNDGGGFFREEKETIASKGLAQCVMFMPFVRDVASTLKGLDLVVMPSLWEACGLLAMEALAAGVPLIGTNCVGLREVLRDTPARIVPAANSLALAKAIVSEMNSRTTGEVRAFVPAAEKRFEVKHRAMELEELMRKYLRT